MLKPVSDDGRLRFLRRAADRPRRARFRRGVYLLPSLFTLGNMFCGYACIVYAMRGEFETAAPFIGFAIVLDMLDGRIARMTGTASDVRRRVRFAGRRHLVRHGAGDPVVRVGAAAARPPRAGRPASCSSPRRRCGWRASTSRAGGGGDKRYFVGMPSPAAAGDPGGDGVRVSGGLVRLPRGAAGARDGARAGAADGQHDPVPQLQDARPAEPRPYTVLILIAAGIMLITTHPRFVLVVMAYAYLLSAFVGMAMTRFRHRGGHLPAPAASRAAEIRTRRAVRSARDSLHAR